MNDFSEANELQFQIAANRGAQVVQNRFNLRVPGQGVGVTRSAGDGTYYDEDGERQERLKAGMVFNAAPVGP